MTCCVGASTFLAQGQHDREDPVAFVRLTVLLISRSFCFSDTWVIKAGWYKCPLVVKTIFNCIQIAIRDKYTTGPSLSALMKSTILHADGQSRQKESKRNRERAFQRLSEDSMCVTGREWSFWKLELVQVVVLYASSSGTLRYYFHKSTIQKRVKNNPDFALPPSGPPCRSKTLHRDLKHLGLMGRRVVKRGKIMVRMFLLTL